MSPHTPGPWMHERIHDAIPYDWRVLAATGERVAEVADWVAPRAESEEGEANARLIAAAPELLVALEMLREQIVTSGRASDLVLAASQAAIRKATAP